MLVGAARYLAETRQFNGTAVLIFQPGEEGYAGARAMIEDGLPLIVTTGGTGPSARDVTPEATRAVLEKELPGFGEIMRMKSFERVPTAILTRAVAGVAGRSLLVNLPGRPAAIGECLALLAPAIAECLDHVAGWRPVLTADRLAR
jgi:molybdopterin adenylyltransferase